MRPCFPIPQCLRPEYLISKFLQRSLHSRGICLARLSYKNWWSLDLFFFFCRDRKIFNHYSKMNHWALKWFSESPFMWSFPVCQEVLNISQIAIAFHRISPPFFIPARLRQYCRRSFLCSAHCSFGNPIRLGSMRCGSTMIP